MALQWKENTVHEYFNMEVSVTTPGVSATAAVVSMEARDRSTSYFHNTSNTWAML